MAFHVELRHSFHRARSFNMSERDLRRLTALWSEGVEIEFGERRWEPRESDITVLEGPELDPSRLAMGQGWQNALKASVDVTARELGARAPEAAGTRVVLLAFGDETSRAIAASLEALGVRYTQWLELRERVVRGAPAGDQSVAGIAGAVVAVDGESLGAAEALELGLAVGAFGPRTILVTAGGVPPAFYALAADAIRLGDRDALADRLRALGIES